MLSYQKMLWYKNWLETRWRVLFGLGWYALAMLILRQRTPELGKVAASFPLLWIVIAVFSAGTGIKTQSATVSSAKRMPASTNFTLSLPVSRSALFGARTALGLIQMALIFVAASCSLWVVFPSVHGTTTLADAMGNGLAIFACCLAFYFVSALLAIFLDPQWQVYTGIGLVGFCAWLARDTKSSLNVFRALGAQSALITHNVPWAAIAVSFTIAAVLCATTLRIIATREF